MKRLLHRCQPRKLASTSPIVACRKALQGIVVFCLTATCISAAASTTPGQLVSWGRVPINGSGAPSSWDLVEVAVGRDHAVAITTTGSVVFWGDTSGGKFNVPLGASSNVVAVAASYSYSLALRSDGRVFAWGALTNVPPNLTNAIAIAAGVTFALAARSGGQVVAWGSDNAYGQTNVPPGLGGVVKVAAGYGHALALRSDGTVVAWGRGNQGQTNVPASLTNAVAIAAGYDHGLALTADGAVVAWGHNYGGATDVPLAAQSGVMAIAAGGYVSMALKSDGSLVVWGDDSYGQTAIPLSVGKALAIGVGENFCVAITLSPQLSLSGAPPFEFPAGSTSSVSVLVTSPLPHTTQWYRESAAIPWATTSTLTLTNMAVGFAGVYSVVASNDFGVATTNAIIRLANSPTIEVNGAYRGGGSTTCVDIAQITLNRVGTTRDIYYTLDGTDPDFTGIFYTVPFVITNSATIRAIAYNATYTLQAEAAPVDVRIWPTYTLSVFTPGGGRIGTFPYPSVSTNRWLSNSIVTLTATASNGWTFLQWAGATNATENVISLLVDRPKSISAVFGTPLLLLTNGSGQVAVDPPLEFHTFGSLPRVSAIPAPGHYFFGWAGSATGFSNPLSFRVTNAAPSISGLFGVLKSGQVSLTALPSGNGTITVTPARGFYTNGESVTLSATPAPGHVFMGWGGDASGAVNPLTLTLTSSRSIAAYFWPSGGTNSPVITSQPGGVAVGAGSSVALSVVVSGLGPFAYQWRRDGVPVVGATNASLLLASVTAADAALYDVTITGPGGATTSHAVPVAIRQLQFLPVVGIHGTPGTHYRIEYSDEVQPLHWNLLANVALETGRLLYADDTCTNCPKRFYRVIAE